MRIFVSVLFSGFLLILASPAEAGFTRSSLLGPYGCLGNSIVLEKFSVDAYNERFLVVATIEDPNPPALGHVLHAAPQKIVIEVFCRRSLEGIHLAALGVDPVSGRFRAMAEVARKSAANNQP